MKSMNHIKNKISNLKLIRAKLNKKKPSIGTFIQINSPEIAEIIASENFEWIAIDMEHGCINLNDLNNIFRSIDMYNKLPIVRLPNNDIILCRKVLDYGACGVIVPLVESGDQIKEIVKYSKYPPYGNRGVAFMRSNLYGKDFDLYYKQLSKLKLIIAMIENIKGLENLDDILSTKYLDSIFIGPYDLSASLGCPGDFNNKKFIAAINIIKSKCKKYRIPYGIHVVEPNKKTLTKTIKEGYNFIAFSMDTRFIIDSIKKNYK
mgnify:CR=1 FL=1